MKSINVYIDGACSNNGQPNALAGYGIYFGENDSRNEFKRVQGKQSNNTGELTAFIRTLEILEPDIKNNVTIHLYTDSEYVIKCVSSYGKKLEKNNWKTTENKIPPNLELLKKAYHLFKNKTNIKLHHIEAHTGKNDPHSIGNYHADRLACLSIGKTNESHQNEEVQLDWITFHNKNKAKELGAKWNAKNKYWYVNKNVDDQIMKELILLKTEEEPKNNENKIYIKISFANKNKAKSFGARWDPSVKSWYYIEAEISTERKKELDKLSGS